MKHSVRGLAAACIAILSVGAEASQPASQPSHGSGASVPVEVTADAVGRILSVTTPEGTTSYRYFEGTNEPLIQEVTKPDGNSEQYSLDVATSAYHALLGSTATSSSSSNPCSGANRFGFNGYLWECELGSYLTPSGRLYDPELGRFLQQDAYLGDIANPPSLHRYTFGHNNPTSFVDPTGHESYRQWIHLDKPSSSVGHEFLKHLGYNAFNLVSFGALARQDTLVEQSEAGRITELQYQGGSAINLVGTGATAAATFATGGVAGQVAARAGGSLVLAGAAGGGAAGLVASTGSADVDMATGTRSPLDVHATEFVAPTVLGAAAGAAFGAGAATGVRPFAEPVRGPPPSLNSSRAMVVTEGPGGASAADQVRLVPVGQVAEPAVSVPGRPASSSFYSTVFEAHLQRGKHYPGSSAQRHFQEANRQLHEAMQADPQLAAQLEGIYPGIMQGSAPGPRGAFPRKPPTADVSWHHHPNREGVLQLVPYAEHAAPGPVQRTLHPEQRGGMETWGGGRTRKEQ